MHPDTARERTTAVVTVARVDAIEIFDTNGSLNKFLDNDQNDATY